MVRGEVRSASLRQSWTDVGCKSSTLPPTRVLPPKDPRVDPVDPPHPWGSGLVWLIDDVGPPVRRAGRDCGSYPAAPACGPVALLGGAKTEGEVALRWEDFGREGGDLAGV